MTDTLTLEINEMSFSAICHENNRLRAALIDTVGSAQALCDMLNPQVLPAGAEQQLEATYHQLQSVQRDFNL